MIRVYELDERIVDLPNSNDSYLEIQAQKTQEAMDFRKSIINNNDQIWLCWSD